MKIKVKWEVDAPCGIEFINDLEDINIKSFSEWNELSELEKKSILQHYLNELPERVSIILDKYEIED